VQLRTENRYKLYGARVCE